MRTSRNRNWAHPALVSLIEKLASDAKQNDGWNGLLVGDLSQPRGGPMLTGHASHQIGLDADVWFTPMPDHVLTDKERESLVPIDMVKDRSTLNHDTWTEIGPN
jgi:penicillin-insensitive murein endopeptidase